MAGEGRKLILSFLSVRDRPRPSRLSTNEESQGIYDDEIDWNAPDLLEVAGEDAKALQRLSREKEIAEVRSTGVNSSFST